MKTTSTIVSLLVVSRASAFSTPSILTEPTLTKAQVRSPILTPSRVRGLKASSTTALPTEESTPIPSKALFSLKTKLGYINPYGVYYGLVAIALGIPWLLALTLCQLFYKVTGGKIDKFRRMPIFFSHVWGVLLMRLTGCYPKIEGKEKLENFYKENRAAMFVANHNSWMDIPFLGGTIGWRNYKIVAKKELEKVPALGKSISCGGHVMVDRANRRSQLMTLKAGMQWLKDGIHLCTFPEGTRSKSGRLLSFKNGAFKMAHKQGSPIIPISIVGTGKAHPYNYIFPFKSTRKIGKVVVHDPIESNDKTEGELAKAVRQSIIDGLPEEQRPSNEDD